MALAAIPGRAQQNMPPTDVPVPADKLVQMKISRPQPLNNVEASFSDEAREKRINGRCLASITVDVRGMPQDIKLIRCTDPSFQASSLAAVGQYRFKPAMMPDGKPIPVKINVEISYHIDGGRDSGPPIRYRFSTPPGTTTSEPDPDGVYPLTKLAAPPTITRFSDEGFGEAAFMVAGNSPCDIVLTISANGKASDVAVTHCERPSLEKPAVQSLLKSHYKPGSVNGVAVPIRTSIHLEYGDVPPKS
jgi:hypothetical protein